MNLNPQIPVDEGYNIFCNNVECPEIIPYITTYTLSEYCTWTCKSIQEERENKSRYTKVSRTAKLPALDPKDCNKEFFSQSYKNLKPKEWGPVIPDEMHNPMNKNDQNTNC